LNDDFGEAITRQYSLQPNLRGFTKPVTLSVSNASVHAWINEKNIPDIDIARKVSILTGIKLDDLRPVPVARSSWF
jgi:hypothetical protein